MSAQTSLRERWLEESSMLRFYFLKYRKYVVIGLLALLTVDILEMLPPLFIKEAVDIATEHHPLRLLIYVAAAYFGVSLLQGVCRYLWRMYLIRASMFAGRDIRNEYAGHLFGLSISFFDKKRIGDLMSLATNDVEAIRQTLGNGLLVFADALFYFITVPVAMYFLSPKLMLIAFAPLPIIPFVVLRNEREIHKRFERVQECFSEMSAQVQEGLTGIRVTKAFAKEEIQVKRLKDLGEKFIRLNLDLARVQTAFGPTLDFTMSLGLVFLIWFGGRDLIYNHDIKTAITLGTFVAFQRYIQKMVWPMAAVGMAASYYQRSVTSSDRMKEILTSRTDVPEIAEPKLPADYRKADRTGAAWKTQGLVELKNLSFKFPSSEHYVLKNLSLKIAPGERIAFVGAVGAGKSALLSLLPRMYPVERGMLLIDGIDVNDWPIGELRRQVGYVSQDVFLFSETVTENVAFGLHERMGGWIESNSNPASIEDATRLASVHEDVLGLSGSYRTRLGERGVNLSGGQKQRLTIARALAKEPSILVMDDALSSVDVQTEEKILQGLRARAGRNTEIISAHRISTVKDADRIVVLEEGEIRQLGTHAELVADRRGAYRKFYEQQRLKEDLENYVEALS